MIQAFLSKKLALNWADFFFFWSLKISRSNHFVVSKQYSSAASLTAWDGKASPRESGEPPSTCLVLCLLELPRRHNHQYHRGQHRERITDGGMTSLAPWKQKQAWWFQRSKKWNIRQHQPSEEKNKKKITFEKCPEFLNYVVTSKR